MGKPEPLDMWAEFDEEGTVALTGPMRVPIPRHIHVDMELYSKEGASLILHYMGYRIAENHPDDPNEVGMDLCLET